MQKYGFFFIQVAAILNVPNMAAKGGGGVGVGGGGGRGGGGGLKCFHNIFIPHGLKYLWLVLAKPPKL